MMATKKQIDQDSLRRLMRQKKNEMTSKKVDHPLAKYNSLDQLICSLCQSRVKSAALWNAHLQSRTHKENLEIEAESQKRRSKAPSSGAPPAKVLRTAVPEMTGRKAPVGGVTRLVDFGSSSEEEDEKVSAKTSLSSNAKGSRADLPSDFFSSSSGTSLASRVRRRPRGEPEEEEKKKKVEEKREEKMADRLPEGFFDDPVKDAEVRQVPYQSKIDEELEVFQKAMKEMTQESEAIIDEDDKIMEVERSLSNIDELMGRWKRINELELRKEAIAQKKPHTKELPCLKEEPKAEEESKSDVKEIHKEKSKVKAEEISSEEDDDDADPDDTALLWRAKRML